MSLNAQKVAFVILGTLLAIYSLVLVEDAFIPLRVVNQFWSGNGLVWNMGERVQVCTSLLWQLLLLPTYWFGSPPTGLIFLCILLTTGFLYSLAKATQSTDSLLLLGLAWLTCSTLIDFSVSGLEVPLTSLVIALTIIAYHNNPTGKQVALLIGLLPLCRHDIGLIALPFLIERGFFWIKSKKWGHIALAIAPLTIFSLFSLFYFGSIFPNTYYTKIACEAPHMLRNGLDYLSASISYDLTLLSIPLLGILLLPKARVTLLTGIGCTLYVLYLAHAGDYMLGRMLLPTTAAGMTLISLSIPSTKQTLICAGILVASFFLSTKTNQDPRFCYEKSTGVGIPLKNFLQPNPLIHHDWATIGSSLLPNSSSSQGSIGILGYTAPNSHYIRDFLCIADPNLARLPSPFTNNPRPGHYPRAFPQGYLGYTITKNPEKIEPEKIRELCKLTKSICSGPLLSWERIKNIFRLQLWKLTPEEKYALLFPTALKTPPKAVLLNTQGAIFPKEDKKYLILEADGPFLLTALSKYKPLWKKAVSTRPKTRYQNFFEFEIPKNCDMLHIQPISDQEQLTIGSTAFSNQKIQRIKIPGYNPNNAVGDDFWGTRLPAPITSPTEIPISPTSGNFTLFVEPQAPVYIKNPLPKKPGEEIHLKDATSLTIIPEIPTQVDWIFLIPTN